MNQDDKITLYYFNFPGRAELIRLILHYNDINFEDKRITFDEWKDFKQAHKELFPFGQMPVLEWNGKIYAQSQAIAKFLAQKFGQYPTDPETQFEVDQIRELINNDIYEDWFRQFVLDEEKRKGYADDFFNTRFPEKLSYINDLIKKTGNNGYIVGNSLTLADFTLWNLAEGFLSHPNWKEKSVPVFEKFPELQEYLKKRDEDPKWQAYLKKKIIPTYPK